MKKDVNLVLFGLVIFLLFSMLGLTLYYQETYKSLDVSHKKAMDKIKETEYSLNETKDEMIKKSLELDAQEKELIEIINELNISKQKVSSLGDYYQNLRGEKEVLETSLDEAESARDNFKLGLDEKIKELEVCEKNKGLIQNELADVSDRLSIAKGKAGNMSSIIHSLSMNLDEMDKIIDDDISPELEDIKDDLDKNKNVSKSDVNRVDGGVNDLSNKLDSSNNLLDLIRSINAKIEDI
ncbi:MAG: hypothetical protein B6U97_00895 [Candidatus Altiarchaeales archaeon ex4484_96]|nr:MAG: hypothetical protein B6U97_00895 [Candidatus Altiarchaeales archaeon ex4484_96]